MFFLVLIWTFSSYINDIFAIYSHACLSYEKIIVAAKHIMQVMEVQEELLQFVAALKKIIAII
jgi:hypothetical protein